MTVCADSSGSRLQILVANTTLQQNRRNAVRALAQDHLSGSAELALRACGILEACGREDKLPPSSAETIARAVARAQPSMAAVLNVANRWLCAVEKGEPPAAAARRLAQELRNAQRATAAHAASLIANHATVLTYSFSSTVLVALRQARKQGRRFRVLCSEARPQMEGRTLARRLAESGIPVELFTDAALFSAIREADLVLVGCDTIGSLGFVNKIGSLGLLGLARRWGVAFHLVGDTFKLLPPGLEPWFKIRSEKAAEVWKVAQRKIRVHNVYFEKVPWAGCACVVLETGVWTPREIRRLLHETEIAAAFRS